MSKKAAVLGVGRLLFFMFVGQSVSQMSLHSP